MVNRETKKKKKKKREVVVDVAGTGCRTGGAAPEARRTGTASALPIRGFRPCEGYVPRAFSVQAVRRPTGLVRAAVVVRTAQTGYADLAYTLA